MCINEGSGATDYTLIGEFKPLLISSFVLRAILWLRRPNVINRYKNGVDESKESKSLVYITHVLCCKVAWAFFPREEKLLDHMAVKCQTVICCIPNQPSAKVLGNPA